MNQWHSPDRSHAYPPDAEDAALNGVATPAGPREGAADLGLAKRLIGQLDRWIASMERLNLGEYMRYINDRKHMLWTNLLGSMARGLGMAMGFTILGAVLVIVLQNLAKKNLPLIGDVLAQIVSIVQNKLQ